MANGDSPKAKPKRLSAALRRDRTRNQRVARWLIVFVLLVIAFVVGFLIRSQTSLMTSLGIPISAAEEGPTSKLATSNLSTFNSVAARVADVEELLSSQSLDTVNLDQATTSMLTAMMTSTDDPNAAYLDPERYANYVKESTERSYGGIGVLFAEYNSRVYVSDVFSGSEAEAKGVEQGDFIQAIDGVSTRQWSLAEVVGDLSDREGEEVVISWMRPTSLDAETGSEFTTTLLCERYSETNLTSELADTVGYIQLRQITQNATNLVKSAVESLTAAGAQAFVLDLRDNPGGYLTQAVDIASLFLPSGVIVQIETIDGITTKSSSGVTITTAPLVVLVNGYTAAASEVLAGALQDNQRAEIVGERTQGKGSVQVMRELDFGGAIRYTAAYYLTPLGHDINNVGIQPTIEVGNSDGGDTQRLVAIDTAKSLIPR